MSQFRIICICQRATNITNCSQNGGYLITKQGAVKEHQGHTNKMDSESLENHVWICAHTNYLDQDVVLWAIWFLCSCGN